MYKYSPRLVAVILVLLGVGLAGWQFLTIKSTGLPLGPAVRLPDAIAQIIHTRERYLPSLHRNPKKDRYRLDLLLVSLADPARQEMITLARTQEHGALQPMTKILGADGDLVWVNAPGILAVNRKTGKVSRMKELQSANPELHLFLNTARFEFTNGLVAVSPDGQQAYSFAPDSLRASACAPPSRGNWISEQARQSVEGMLCSGGLRGGTNWWGALVAGDLTSSFRPGTSLPREFPANMKDESRQLYRGQIDPSETRPRIVAMERIGETGYRGVAFLREVTGAKMLQLTNPESALMLHRVSTELFAPWALVRVTPEGKTVWTADTGIGRINQILPDAKLVALIGERPPVPNKVPEPILVLINTSTGATNSVSLWR